MKRISYQLPFFNLNPSLLFYIRFYIYIFSKMPLEIWHNHINFQAENWSDLYGLYCFIKTEYYTPLDRLVGFVIFLVPQVVIWQVIKCRIKYIFRSYDFFIYKRVRKNIDKKNNKKINHKKAYLLCKSFACHVIAF